MCPFVCARMKNIPVNGDRDLIQLKAKLQSNLPLSHNYKLRQFVPISIINHIKYINPINNPIINWK